MSIIKNKLIFIGVSAALVIVSVIAIVSYGLPYGIDFTGGTLIEVSYPNGIELRPSVADIRSDLELVTGTNVRVQETDNDGLIIRSQSVTPEKRDAIFTVLTGGGKAEIVEERFTSIGPIIGEELKSKALKAILLVVVVIIVFIAFVFRQVSDPVKSWKYGVIAIVALIHDIIIPTGLFAVLGAYTNAQVDTLFVTALLAILGLSINDTIVVFDRIRENLKLKISSDFGETVETSLKETITRSVNTSITTLIVLLALYFVGPESTKFFALTLSVGLIAGTYSSLFLASPLLVVLAGKKS